MKIRLAVLAGVALATGFLPLMLLLATAPAAALPQERSAELDLQRPITQDQACFRFVDNRTLVGPLARSPGLRLALALEIERHCSADEILQGRRIELVAFVDVDGAPGIPAEARVEET